MLIKLKFVEHKLKMFKRWLFLQKPNTSIYFNA